MREEFIRLISIPKMGFSKQEIYETIHHEREHIQKGIELGYHFLRYGLKISVYENDSCKIHIWINFREKIKPEEVMEIALAPENPSQIDLNLSKEYPKP